MHAFHLVTSTPAAGPGAARSRLGVIALLVLFAVGFAGNVNAAGVLDAGPGHPFGIATSARGDVYIADTLANVIRRIAPDGSVSVIAGKAGEIGSADGQGGAARFFAPAGIALDAAGNLYVADTGNDTVRRIAATGEVSTVAGEAGSAGSADGRGAAARFCDPFDLAVDAEGIVYVADSGNNTIRRIGRDGSVSTLAGGAGEAGAADGEGRAARFSHPYGIASGALGEVYVADTYNHTIRHIAANGMVTTIAGTAGLSGLADGTGAKVRLFAPADLVVAPDHTVFVADTGNAVLRRISPAGDVRTIAGAAGQRFPMGIASDLDGRLYVSLPVRKTVLRIERNGTVHAMVGTPAPLVTVGLAQ